uniref:Type IV pilus modification protein PilV n=1 Tax=Shewanella sp. (strain MR-7) TaxID=60481 RepID=Q0HS86_SHESR
MTKCGHLTLTKYQQGISLIEVLVALVILVIGLIGIFNLHIVAKRGSFESFQQTQASYYATDIINRMKLNRTELANYNGTYSGTPTAVSKACEDNTLCNPAELKSWDIFEWQSLFIGAAETVGSLNVGGLDTPTACVQVVGNDVLVAIVWKGISSTNIDTSAIEDTVVSCGSGTPNRRIFSIRTVII